MDHVPFPFIRSVWCLPIYRWIVATDLFSSWLLSLLILYSHSRFRARFKSLTSLARSSKRQVDGRFQPRSCLIHLPLRLVRLCKDPSGHRRTLASLSGEAAREYHRLELRSPFHPSVEEKSPRQGNTHLALYASFVCLSLAVSRRHLLPHDKPTGISLQAAVSVSSQTQHWIYTVRLFSLSRSENHCRRCDRIREEPAWCDNPDDVLPLRLCADGPSDLHGGPHAKVYKELSWGRLLG